MPTTETIAPATGLGILDVPEVQDALALHGTPLFVLDTDAAVSAYRELVAELPAVTPHYAVKALDHPQLLEALAAAGSGFDVASSVEVDRVLAHGGTPDRIVHTHPHARADAIAHAVGRGVRTFTVDGPSQAAVLAGFPGVEAMVRLAFPNPRAAVDLSSKFGVTPDEVPRLARDIRALGVPLRGLSFHVGSQSVDPAAFAVALGRTVALVDRLRREGHDLRTIDLGGGFPVAYRQRVPALRRIAAAIRPLVEERPDIGFLSEPGRCVAAPAMTLITSVVSISHRRGSGRWVFVDDGLYGGYSNVLSDHVDPVVLTTSTRPRRPQTIAGPTCDSLDVVARRRILPELAAGDLLVSPMMGAYTTVTATDFNGIPRTPVVAIRRADVSRSAASASSPA